MNPLTIIGAGGHGKVVADTAEALGYADISFVDQAWPDRQTNGRWRIVGAVPRTRGGSDYFCAIGANSVRVQLFESLDLWDGPALCHPSAVISPTASVGAGAFAAAGIVINADAVVGRGAILSAGCVVEHDCVLEDFVHMSPGAQLASGVVVGARSLIGVGAVVCQGLRIGSDAVIAAGATVIADVPDGAHIGGSVANAGR